MCFQILRDRKELREQSVQGSCVYQAANSCGLELEKRESEDHEAETRRTKDELRKAAVLSMAYQASAHGEALQVLQSRQQADPRTQYVRADAW